MTRGKHPQLTTGYIDSTFNKTRLVINSKIITDDCKLKLVKFTCYSLLFYSIYIPENPRIHRLIHHNFQNVIVVPKDHGFDSTVRVCSKYGPTLSTTKNTFYV